MPPLNMDPIEVRYVGLFDFDGLYAAVTDWAKNYGYMWHEKTYKHKVNPDGAEQEMEWELSKMVTDYIAHQILILVHMYDLTEAKVVSDGKTKALANARIFIRIKGTLQWDWQNQFRGGKFTKKLGAIYNRLTQKDIEATYYDMLYYYLWNLQALLKKYFDMQTKKHAYKGYLKDN